MRLALCFVLATSVFAADWPEWRGAGRRGALNETGILDTFPATGLKVKWRTPIQAGYSGPSREQEAVQAPTSIRNSSASTFGTGNTAPTVRSHSKVVEMVLNNSKSEQTVDRQNMVSAIGS
jgi:hypothetical protein